MKRNISILAIVYLFYGVLITPLFAQRQAFKKVLADTAKGYQKDSLYILSKTGVMTPVGDSALQVLNFRVRGGARVDSSFRVASLTTNGIVTISSGLFSSRASDTVGSATALALKAPLASPTFTGTVTMPLGAGTVRSSSGGVLSSTASDTVGLGSALAGKLGTSTISGLAAPSIKVTATATTGSGTTAMRSDGSPALDTNYAWTWTGINTHSNRVDLVNSGHGFANRTLADTSGGSDSSFFSTQYKGQRWVMYDGSFASPVTTGGTSMKIVRTQNIDSTVIAVKSDPEPNSALFVFNKATINNFGQPIAITGAAQTYSNRSYSTGNDAAGVAGYGRAMVGATGIGLGAFFDGRRDDAGGKANALQLAVSDWSSRGGATYNVAGFDSTSALWFSNHGTAGNVISSYIKIGNGDAVQGLVGIGFTNQNGGPVRTADFQTNDTARYAIQINGTHNDAAIAVASGSGRVGIGTLTPTQAPLVIGGTQALNQMLYINASNTGTLTSQLQGFYNNVGIAPGGASLTSAYGILNTPSLTSTNYTVTNASGVNSSFNTTAGFSGIITNLRGFESTAPTISGGTVTNYHGFYANNVSSGGTINTAFYGNMASGTGKWNAYMNGTATNFFSGNTSVGSTTTTSQFNVGSAAQFQVNSSGAVVTLGNIAAQGPFGVPNIVDTIQQTGQTATIAASNITGTAVNGVYRISVYLYPTTAGTSGTVTATIKWNDGAAESAVTGTHTFGALGTPVFINGQICTVTNSTAITWETTVTSPVGSPVYVVNVIAERLF